METLELTRHHPAFPRRLAEVADAPETLFVRGDLPVGHERVVALVGARAASGNGMARAHELAATLAEAGVLVVSGGAIGIDAASHAGAMAVGKPTVVVLATGLDAPYPVRHRPFFDEIVERGGALVSSFQPGVPLRRWHFPRRNRVIAGLADAVVVVEASPASGSLYTAQAARDYGRVLGACPGTAGTEALLAQGAALVESGADVLAALEGSPRHPTCPVPEAGTDEARALAALDTAAPRALGEVCARTGVDAGRTAAALCLLELEGLALLVPGGRYVRSALAERMLS